MADAEAPDSVRERPLGWARVGCASLFAVAIPCWLLLTAVAIQLSPKLNGTTVLADETAGLGAATWFEWITAAFDVGLWMLPAIPTIMVAMIVGRAFQEAGRLKNQADHQRYAELISGQAVIDDPAWQEPVDPDADAASKG